MNGGWSTWLRPRRVAMVAALTAFWCVLWHDLSVANVLAGFVIAVVVMATGAGGPSVGGVRLGPLLALLWMITVDVVTSTITVAIETLTPGDQTEESIVAVPLPAGARAHFLLMTIAITLTPGTAVVDGDVDTGTLYVHLLHHRDRESNQRYVERLNEVAGRALPVREREGVS